MSFPAKLSMSSAVVLFALAGCEPKAVTIDDAGTPPVTVAGCGAASEDLGLPEGICATVAADHLGIARHISFSPSGDLYVAVQTSRDGKVPGHALALRDADHDGVFEQQQVFHDVGGSGIDWHGGFLYFAENTRVIRFALPDGQLAPTEAPVVIVSGLPDSGDHPAKAILVDDQNQLWVNIGSETNSCQAANRMLESPGLDPCPELAVRAGLWRYDANTANQVHATANRFATGLRNATAIDRRPEDGVLYGIINGRDQLHENWPMKFSESQEQTMPAEELFAITQNADYGWPYCFYNPMLQKKVLAPEYGGDGMTEGRCAATTAPLSFLPAHWSPLSMLFFRGDKLPERYRGGAFFANHGNRFIPDSANPPGYNVVFIPWNGAQPARTFDVFASNFAGSARPLPDAAAHRPLGLAQSPDGALYISDDWAGRIWRVTAMADQ